MSTNEKEETSSVYNRHITEIKFSAVIFCVFLFVTLTILSFSNKFVSNQSKKDNISDVDVPIVSRTEWGAIPLYKPPERLQLIPAPYVIISHTGTNFCNTLAQCAMKVRFTQTFHMESFGWNDIGYNFLVGGDGNAYEGRGWDIEGAHTFNYNRKSIGISFIGTFDHVKPTKGQIHAALKLIEFGVENGHISKDYKLLGHRQLVKTESPGQKVYEIIQTWDHWVPQP